MQIQVITRICDVCGEKETSTNATAWRTVVKYDKATEDYCSDQCELKALQERVTGKVTEEPVEVYESSLAHPDAPKRRRYQRSNADIIVYGRKHPEQWMEYGMFATERAALECCQAINNKMRPDFMGFRAAMNHRGPEQFMVYVRWFNS